MTDNDATGPATPSADSGPGERRHEWMKPFGFGITDDDDVTRVCRFCGVVRRADREGEPCKYANEPVTPPAGEPAPGGEAVLWTGMLPLIGYHRVRSLGPILPNDPQSHETFAVEWDTDDGWEDSDYKEELCGHLVKLLRAAKG